jgi:flagellar biosynthesis/type III secretory pathway M-ring protein FliF/YscJ
MSPSELVSDLPIALLATGIVVLLAAMALMTASLPAMRWRPWRRRRRPEAATVRRGVVTGRPPTLAQHGRPPRQPARAADVLSETIDVRGAEQVIEHYLDTDPRALAQVISAWISTDEPRPRRTTR